MARNRLTTLPYVDVSQSAPEKRRCGHPPTKRPIEPIAPIPELNEVLADDRNKTLPTLYPVRRHRRQPALVAPQVLAPTELPPYYNDETALKQIHTCNLQDNKDFTHRPTTHNNIPTGPTTHNNIPHVTETIQTVIFHACINLLLLTVKTFSSKHTDMCHTKWSSIK